MERSESAYTIGKLAKMAGVNIQTIRFYERQGILKPVNRLDSGYRLYTKDSLKTLNFIRQAKQLGFSLHEIKELLGLRIKSSGSRENVRTKANTKLQEDREKIKSLKTLERTLKSLIGDCEGKVSQCCPIIDRMENENVISRKKA